MTVSLLGQVALGAALVLSVTALVTGRRRLLGAAAVAAAASTVILVFALVTGDFSLEYVALTTSLATPWPYRVAALWGGMDGSMLFYSTMTLVVAAVGLRAPRAVRVGAGVGAGLLAVTWLFANPFSVSDIPAVDGEGLLAILQHPAMIYHPPILYLGLVLLVVPFAETIARWGVVGGRREWLAGLRPWVYLSWALLTFGMAFGANWAYVELGWGGFWAWDPVENTALMPWLALTILLHAMRVEGADGRMRRWNVLFAGLPFALSVMGIYLTRSGVTGSIHSFAEDPVVGRVLLVSAVVVAILVAVTAIRSDRGEAWGPVRLDRAGWLAINTVLLTAALVFVTAGSAYPAFRSVFGGAQVVVDSRFFVLTVLPIAVLVSIAVAISLGGSPLWYGVLAGLALLMSVIVAGGLRPGNVLLAVAVTSVLTVGSLLMRERPKRRLLVAHAAHLGIALTLVGVAGSALGEDFTGSMVPGDEVIVSGHTIRLASVEPGESDRYVYVRATFTVDGETVTPEIRGYEDQPTPVAEPALISRPAGDVIVAVSLLFPDGETVAVSVFVRPLTWLVWLGAGLIGLTGLFALSARGGAGAGRRRSATGELQPGETTIGTASP